jgi:hypothetical protein
VHFEADDDLVRQGHSHLFNFQAPWGASGPFNPETAS